MTVITYWAWETTATLRLLGGARGARAPAGDERGGGISCRHAHSLFDVICVFCLLVVLVRLSVPVQVIDWKDSSPK